MGSLMVCFRSSFLSVIYFNLLYSQQFLANKDIFKAKNLGCDAPQSHLAVLEDPQSQPPAMLRCLGYNVGGSRGGGGGK